jgi:hypothetical protein
MGKLRIISVPAVLALALMGSVSAPRMQASEKDGPAVLQPVPGPVGDFNGDGFADLALGVPFEDVSRRTDGGAVNVIYGSATGLVSAGNQFWNQDSPEVGDSVQRSDQFGFTAAAADFDGDGFDDLAVGVPLEDPPEDSGAVNVIYGSGAGLTAAGNQVWTQDSGGIRDFREAGDQFGRALIGGDFNRDGYADLAIGVPFENVSAHSDAGAVNVIYGSAAGLTATGNQFWSQDSPGINNASERGDLFGFALATADFDGDSHADLAVGVPGEDPPLDSGVVNVIYGSASGLSSAGDQVWGQDHPGIVGTAEPVDTFGYSVAGGDFDADGFDDLAVGIPFEDVGRKANAGALNVIYGSAGGLTSAGSQLWTQDSPGIANVAEGRDEFGFALATEDFNEDGSTDVAIGIPGEDPPTNAGSVAVIFGGPSGLSSTGDELWSQLGLGGSPPEVWDGFGFSLSAGRFGKDPAADLAIGVPFEDVRTTVDAGAVNVLYGSEDGIDPSSNQYWTQNNLRGSAERGDRFGYGVGGHPTG